MPARTPATLPTAMMITKTPAAGPRIPPPFAFPRTGKRGVPQQFPRRLYEMLDGETKCIELSSKHPKIISWSTSGKAFRIFNAQEFALTVLPKYFRTTKFSSFQRNLNLYGFTKVRRGADTDMYAHPSFMRNNPDALIELRKVSASTGAMLSHSLTQRQGASAESTRFGESLATCNDVNVNKPSELPRRSVSPSHSSTCSTGSQCSSPVVAMDNSKLFFPSREIYDMGRRTIGADSSASSLAEGNGLSIQTSSQPHRQNQRPNVVPPCPIPLLNHNVSGAYDKKVMSGGDRGRLDLLALALEYECFKSCALKMENKI